MQETIKRHLSYKEELALAAFFSNVEKFKCLADMPLFSKGLLTEPFHTRETDRAPLATILSCLKILYDLPGHEDLKDRNDAIIEIVRKKTGLIIDESADLSEYNPSGSGNILGISDYKRLYSWILQFRAKGYSQGEEDWSTLLCKYDYAVNNALREQHLKRLECELSDEELIQARGEAESDEKSAKILLPITGVRCLKKSRHSSIRLIRLVLFWPCSTKEKYSQEFTPQNRRYTCMKTSSGISLQPHAT